jgi:putative membrane protein
MISSAERDRLAHAIRDAEARTAGEIVVVVAERASAYRSVPLLLALLAALLVPWPLIWITVLSASRIFMVQLAVALVLSVVLSWPSRRYNLVPGFIKRARAHEAAAREFVARPGPHRDPHLRGIGGALRGDHRRYGNSRPGR